MARRKKITLKRFVKDIQTAVQLNHTKVMKNYMKHVSTEAMLTIPTSGSGYLAKKTVVTTGRARPTASRADARAARLKLGRRRRGNSEGSRDRAIKTAVSKIERIKDERLARQMTKRDATLLRVVFGAYYSKFVSPRYDASRRKLPRVVTARLKAKRLRK